MANRHPFRTVGGLAWEPCPAMRLRTGWSGAGLRRRKQERQFFGERQGAKRLGQQRPTVQIAPAFAAGELSQESEFLSCFNAFGDHPQVQAMGHGNDCGNDRGVVPVALGVGNQRSIFVSSIGRRLR